MRRTVALVMVSPAATVALSHVGLADGAAWKVILKVPVVAGTLLSGIRLQTCTSIV